MSNKNSRLIRVYATTNSTEAHLARNVLEENGIKASVSGDHLVHVGLGNAGAVEVYAFEENAMAAREILEQWWANHKLDEDSESSTWPSEDDEHELNDLP